MERIEFEKYWISVLKSDGTKIRDFPFNEINCKPLTAMLCLVAIKKDIISKKYIPKKFLDIIENVDEYGKQFKNIVKNPYSILQAPPHIQNNIFLAYTAVSLEPQLRHKHLLAHEYVEYNNQYTKPKYETVKPPPPKDRNFIIEGEPSDPNFRIKLFPYNADPEPELKVEITPEIKSYKTKLILTPTPKNDIKLYFTEKNNKSVSPKIIIKNTENSMSTDNYFCKPFKFEFESDEFDTGC